MKHYTGKSKARSLIAEAISNNIIPNLISNNASMTAEKTYAPISDKRRKDFLANFCAVLISGNKDKALAMSDQVLREGVLVNDLFLDQYSQSARLLGDMWSEDKCSFGDVSIGLGVLHDLVRNYTARLSFELKPTAFDATIYLSPMPGQGHFYGAFMLEAYFLAAKWNVSAKLSQSREALLNDIATNSFSVIALSVAETNKIEDCKKLIENIRNMSLNTEVKVLVGGYPFVEDEELFQKVGADATADNALAALDKMEAICNENNQLN